MQTRNWILLAIAVAVGLIAVMIANAWFSGMEERQATTAQQQQLTRIVVASQPLDFGTRLTGQNLRLQDWPAGSVPDGAFRTLPDALRDNRVALRPIVPGEPVLASKVSGSDGRATLAALLTPGMRAVSIPIDDTKGVAGFVLPGTMVDVILTRQIGGEGAGSNDVRSDVMLENVQVLAVDQVASDKEGKPKVGKTATLAVTLRDAQRLAIADRVGTLSLALRKIEDADTGAAPGAASATATVTSRNLAGPNLAIAGSRSAPAGGYAPVAAVPASLAAAGPLQGPLAGMPAATVPAGRSMIIVRGTQATAYPVAK